MNDVTIFSVCVSGLGRIRAVYVWLVIFGEAPTRFMNLEFFFFVDFGGVGVGGQTRSLLDVSPAGAHEPCSINKPHSH